MLLVICFDSNTLMADSAINDSYTQSCNMSFQVLFNTGDKFNL